MTKRKSAKTAPPEEPEEIVDDAELKSFSSWKFDLLEMVNADPKTIPTDVAIMEAYLHFTRARSRTAYLSALSLRVRTGIVSAATIWARRKVLIKLGYLVPNGRTKKGVEVFRLVNARQSIVLDHMMEATEKLKEMDAARRQKDREKRNANTNVPSKTEETRKANVSSNIETGRTNVPSKTEETGIQKLKTNTCRETPIYPDSTDVGDQSQRPSSDAYARASRGY